MSGPTVGLLDQSLHSNENTGWPLHVLEFEKHHVGNVLHTSSKLNFSKDCEIGLNISWMRKLKFREVKLFLKSTEAIGDQDEIWCFIFLLQIVFLSCYISVITAVIVSKYNVVLNKKRNKRQLSIESLIITELWKKKRLNEINRIR